MKIPEADYVIRIVGDPDVSFVDEHEVIPFDERENYENFSEMLDKRGVVYSPQEPLADNGGVRA
jgi:hypothetical protein